MNDWYDKTGIFIEESLNRFICIVKVEDEMVECYVQSSCRLDNFIDLKEKEVYLKKIKKPKRAKFILVGCKYKNSKILLSPKIANDLFNEFLHSRTSSYLGNRKFISKEYTICGYKSDFYISSTKSVFEVKAIIDVFKFVKFPSVYSERALQQLEKIENLIDNGYNCYYEIVSLNPLVKVVSLDDTQNLTVMLKRLIGKGLIVEFKKAVCIKDTWKLVPIKIN